MAEPVTAGAVHLTVIEVAPAAAATPTTGAPGTISVTVFELAEAAPVPMAFVAVTVK